MKENELLKQKIGRIKDVFTDVAGKGTKLTMESENRNLMNNYQVTTSVREGPSNRSTSRVRHSSDGMPVNITLPNSSHTKLVNEDMSGFYTHKNSMTRGDPVPILQNDQLTHY